MVVIKIVVNSSGTVTIRPYLSSNLLRGGFVTNDFISPIIAPPCNSPVFINKLLRLLIFL